MTRRSVYGLILMLGIIPIFAGLLACMPVQIGDPEESLIDTEMTGIWALINPEMGDGDGLGAFYIFESFDKRTWLITGIGVNAGTLVDGSDYELSSYEGYESLAASEEVGPEQIYADGVILYKAWVADIGGKQFFVWEQRGLADEPGAEPEFWIVYRLDRIDDRTLDLQMVNGETEPFDVINPKEFDHPEKIRRAAERVLAAHVDDPVIYSDGDGELIPAMQLLRAEGAVLTFLEDVANDVLME